MTSSVRASPRGGVVPEGSVRDDSIEGQARHRVQLVAPRLRRTREGPGSRVNRAVPGARKSLAPGGSRDPAGARPHHKSLRPLRRTPGAAARRGRRARSAGDVPELLRDEPGRAVAGTQRGRLANYGCMRKGPQSQPNGPPGAGWVRARRPRWPWPRSRASVGRSGRRPREARRASRARSKARASPAYPGCRWGSRRRAASGG